jgi:hypothetical protein
MNAPVPPDDWVTLWPFQADAALWLANGGSILAWEAGTGKTLAGLEAANWVGQPPYLWLCPGIIRWQIADEVRRLYPQLRVQVLTTQTDVLERGVDVVICTYSLARLEPIWKRLFKWTWTALILDEGDALRNPDSKQTRAVYGATPRSKAALWRKAHRTFVLTGNDVIKDPTDLWTHYSRLFPEALVDENTGKPLTWSQWRDEFCTTRENGFGTEITGAKNIPRLREILAPHRLHRAKEGLPPLVVDTIPVDGVDVYKRGNLAPDVAAAVARLIGADAAGMGDDEFRALMEELEPALATLRKSYAEAKAPAVAALLAAHFLGRERGPEHPGALVFSPHPSALLAAKDELDAITRNRITSSFIVGAVREDARPRTIAQFQDGTLDVLFLQTSIARAGLNLQRADRVFIADAAWTPDRNDQAICRAYRAGQTRSVYASYVSLKGSIDERVMKVLARRSRMLKQINGED